MQLPTACVALIRSPYYGRLMRSLRLLLGIVLACAFGIVGGPRAAPASPTGLEGSFELVGVGSYEELVVRLRSGHHARLGYLVDYEAGIVRWCEITRENGRWSGTLRYRLGRWRYVMHWNFRVTAWVHWNGKRYAKRIAGRMRGSFANGESKPRWRFIGRRLDPPEPPLAAFDYEPPNPSVGAATNTVSFDERSYDRGPGVHGKIVSYAWDFGDPFSGAANTSAQRSASHTFALPGVYSVTLTVTDDDGMADSMTRNLTVAP